MLLPLLSACDNEEAARELSEAIDASDRQIISVALTSDDDKLIFEPGETWEFTATGTASDGRTSQLDEIVRWSVSPAGLATIDRDGTLTTLAVTGSQTLTVALEWAQFRESLEVTLSDAALTALDIVATPNPVDECRTSNLSASGLFEDGSERPVRGVTWSVDDSTLTRISGDTLLASDAGTLTLDGTKEGVTAPSLPVSITDSLTTLALAQGASLSLKVGATASLTTEADFTDGDTGVNINTASRWSSSATSVASVDEQGVVRAASLGSAIVTATCGGLSTDIAIEVLAVQDIRIKNPSSERLRPGDTRTLQLVEVLSDGSEGTENLAAADDVLWRVTEGETIATIDEEGKLTMAESFTGYEATFIEIRADYNGNDDTLTLLIEP